MRYGPTGRPSGRQKRDDPGGERAFGVGKDIGGHNRLYHRPAGKLRMRGEGESNKKKTLTLSARHRE